jgi:uncharacterized C2H2 Zn-finger protein
LDLKFFKRSEKQQQEMIDSESLNETTNVGAMKVDESELENDSKDIFKPDEWKGKSKGHIVYDRKGNEIFECLVCKAEFKSKQRLDNHINANHEGDKPFVCYDRYAMIVMENRNTSA